MTNLQVPGRDHEASSPETSSELGVQPAINQNSQHEQSALGTSEKPNEHCPEITFSCDNVPSDKTTVSPNAQQPSQAPILTNSPRPSSSQSKNNSTRYSRPNWRRGSRQRNSPRPGDTSPEKINSRLSKHSSPSSHAISRSSFSRNSEQGETGTRNTRILSPTFPAGTIPYDRSSSSVSKYHGGCFPKEDPALIIGSAYRRRLQYELANSAPKPKRRPINRYYEPEFNDRETVVNVIYTANHDAEQDEIGRARAATLREARALRSGCFLSSSFSTDFFHLSSPKSATSNRDRRFVGGIPTAWHTHSQLSFSTMPGGSDSSSEYPTLLEEDRSLSRFSCSRQSFVPSIDPNVPPSGTQSELGFRPSSERSLLSPNLQALSPGSDGEPSSKGSGFLYQLVTFDHLADNVPSFVRQNVKKNGKLTSESFILKLNHLRRRRAAGDTSGATSNNTPINNTSTKVKVSHVTNNNLTGNGSIHPGNAHDRHGVSI